MTTVKQVQAHIATLVKQDQSDEKQVNSYYEQALSIIKQSINAFFVQYATDTGLDINSVSQQANSWDLQQFEDAINVLTSNVQPDSDLNRQLMAARLQAAGTKRDTLSSIVAASLAIATAKTKAYGNQALKQSYIKEYNYRSPQQKITQFNLPKDVQKQAEFNNKVWIHGQLSITRTQETLNKSLRRGIDKDALRQLIKDNDSKPLANNIDAAAQTGISFNKALLRSNAINNTNDAKNTVFKNDDNVQYGKWITERDDKVCPEYCQPLDGQVFPINEAPVPQVDTHNNCRCSVEPCDADGNLL